VPSDVLTLRQLNRATLARKMLLDRARVPLLRAIEQMIALQAQLPRPPFIGLWSRVAGLSGEDVTSALTQRAIVRGTAMRGTLHLMTAADYLRFRPTLQPGLDRAPRPDATPPRRFVFCPSTTTSSSPARTSAFSPAKTDLRCSSRACACSPLFSRTVLRAGRGRSSERRTMRRLRSGRSSRCPGAFDRNWRKRARRCCDSWNPTRHERGSHSRERSR
jgi:hypothetical protein